MKLFAGILFVLSISIAHSQEFIDLSDQIPDPNGNIAQSGLGMFNNTTVTFDGNFNMILKQDGKYGIYIKGTQQRLPLIFEEVDHFGPNSNLMKYEGQWGQYQEGQFQIEDDPVFIKPDQFAYIGACKELHDRAQKQTNCEGELLLNLLEDVIGEDFKELKGFVNLGVVVDKNGQASIESTINQSVPDVSIQVYELVNNKLGQWEPGMKDGEKVSSSRRVHLQFSK